MGCEAMDLWIPYSLMRTFINSYQLLLNSDNMVSSFSLPRVMEAEIEALIKAGYYSSKSEVVKDALRLLFETRKELKVASAVELYKSGEISLGKAAEIAGVTVVEFKDLLANRGIYRELVAESTEEMDEKLKELSD